MILGSRMQHVVGGDGEPSLIMKYVPNDDSINVGERVVTSGMDKIFPRDIPVGTVSEVKAGNPFKQRRKAPSLFRCAQGRRRSSQPPTMPKRGAGSSPSAPASP